MMSELENIRDEYLSGAKNLHQISCEIINQNSTKISKNEIIKYKKKLLHSYDELLNIDSLFSKNLRITNSYSNLHPDTSNEEFILMNRSFFISNLEKLEKEIMNLENTKQFRLSINIALFALIISSVGILLSIILGCNL